MASAKFLEEALSTDVDESAVSAIVGSLETQLVTSSTGIGAHQAQAGQQNHQVAGIANGNAVATVQPSSQQQSQAQKHGVANGAGTAPVAAQEANAAVKGVGSTLVPVTVVASNAAAPQVTTQQQQQQLPPATTYITQVR